MGLTLDVTSTPSAAVDSVCSDFRLRLQLPPYALLLLQLVQTPVSPHRPECAVHGSQQPRLIFPEPDSEWPRVVWDLRHDA